MDLPLSHLGFSLGISLISGLMGNSSECPPELARKIDQMSESWYADTADWSETLGSTIEDIVQDISASQAPPHATDIIEWDSLVEAAISLVDDTSEWLRGNELHRRAFLEGVVQSFLAVHNVFGDRVVSLVPAHIMTAKFADIALTSEQEQFISIFKTVNGE